MCNIISQLFTCCKHKQFQNIYQCPLITAQVEVQSNGNQTGDLFFCARVVPDRVSSSSPSSSSRSQNTRSDSSTQNLRTMLILCERCPNLRRPSRPVGGYCRDCRRSHLRNGLGAGASYGSRLGELGGWGELPALPRVDLTPYQWENGNDNGNIFVGEGFEGVDQRSASELAGLARLVAGALKDDEQEEHELGTATEREKNKDCTSTGRRLRRKLRGRVNDHGNSTVDGRKIDMGMDKKGSISSSSDHTSGSSATLIMGMTTTATMAAVGGGSSRRGGQGIGVAI